MGEASHSLLLLQIEAYRGERKKSMFAPFGNLADHYHRSPDLISEEEVRQYFLYIKNVKKYSRARSMISICGIQFFYKKTLNYSATEVKTRVTRLNRM